MTQHRRAEDANLPVVYILGFHGIFFNFFFKARCSIFIEKTFLISFLGFSFTVTTCVTCWEIPERVSLQLTQRGRKRAIFHNRAAFT